MYKKWSHKHNQSIWSRDVLNAIKNNFSVICLQLFHYKKKAPPIYSIVTSILTRARISLELEQTRTRNLDLKTPAHMYDLVWKYYHLVVR